jgi:hypothetical protein
MADYDYNADIQLNEEGSHITEVQERLVDQGLLTQTTGTFDEPTQQALLSYTTSLGYSYTTPIDAILALQAQTGPLRDPNWQQKFSTSDPYGHQANLQQSFEGENVDGNTVWAGQRRDRTYYAEGEEGASYNVGFQEGQVGYVGEDGTMDPLNTTDARAAGLKGSKAERYIYAMDSDGQMRVADSYEEHRGLEEDQRFHHSSLFAGEAVSGAGEIKVRDGEVEAVSDKSGHYRPDFAMTSQVRDRLEDGGVDTSRVTFELGNFKDGAGVESETLATGTEVGAYDREGTLADLRTACWQEAEQAAQRKWKPAVWARLADPIKQTEIQSFYAKLYERFQAMDDRTLKAEARKILEGRHETLRSVLDELRETFALTRGWKEDPTGRHQWRFYDGESFTDRVSDNDRESSDPDGAALLGMPFAGSDQVEGQVQDPRVAPLEDDDDDDDEDEDDEEGGDNPLRQDFAAQSYTIGPDGERVFGGQQPSAGTRIDPDYSTPPSGPTSNTYDDLNAQQRERESTE